MPDEQAVVADSASEAQAAPGEAAEPQDVTHGDQAAEQATTDDTTSAESEASPPGDDEDDADLEASETDTEDEAKTKAQKRRERRLQREQERIDKAVAERLAVKEREQQEAAERTRREAEAQKAAQARVDRLSQFIGVPDAPGKPGTIATLNQEIADLNRQIRAEIAEPRGVDLDALSAQVAEREARVARLAENNQMASEIEEYVWSQFEADFVSAAGFPEFTDADLKARYIRAEGGVRGALAVLRDVIKAADKAEKDAEIAILKKSHDSEVSTLREELRGWRIRAGAEEVPDTTSGGSAAVGGDTLTPDRYSRMTSEERQRLRSTPEGRAQIDRMVRSGAA